MLPCVSFRRFDGTTEVVSSDKECLAQIAHVSRVCEMSGTSDCKERVTPHATLIHISEPSAHHVRLSNDETLGDRKCDPQHERVCGYDRGLPRGQCGEDGVCRVPSTVTPGIAHCEQHVTTADGSVLCLATRQRRTLRHGKSVYFGGNVSLGLDAISYECRSQASSHTGGTIVRDLDECAASAAGRDSFEYDAESRTCASTLPTTASLQSHTTLVCRRRAP